jgi:hypothetical protein
MKSIYIKILALAGIISLACTTKVSEWVLLNAPAHTYTLVYFHGGQSGGNAKNLNDALIKDIAGANIRFRDVVSDVKDPYYALYYEDRLFTKYDQYSQLRNLVSSPLRDRIADEIMKGKLCVMLYLKTGNNEKDQKGLSELKRAVEASPFSAILPVMEINRNDAAEKHFISMLLNVEDDLKAINEPMLFGIFGRFKALEPLVAGGIKEENINLMIEFLTADCSCLIKDNLPGTDILYIDKWDSPSTALVNDILDRNPLLQHK